MTVTTVGEMRKALEPYPDNMPLYGYDDRDHGEFDPPISVWTTEYRKDGIDKEDGLVIDVSF